MESYIVHLAICKQGHVLEMLSTSKQKILRVLSYYDYKSTKVTVVRI